MMTQHENIDLKKYKFFKRFSMIQMMLMIAIAGLLLTLVANYFQL
ncbi:MAG TPA: hypothetical protein VGV92_09525 [Gammaproteobacteria bacterium]|nr:hypothetical protein [Gammaproteobacteria bacterium]